MVEKFKKEITQYAKCIDIDLNEVQIDNYYKYMNLILEWNKKINLTAITDEIDIIVKHFIDSMTVLKYIKDNQTVIDIGTGAGFPGIPISIQKNVDMTLVDSLNKRILFLDEVIKELKLNNVKTIHGRAEDLGQNKQYREKCDISISRAVASLNILVEYLLPLVKVGGVCLCMKGSDISEELRNAEYAIDKLGGRVEKIDEFCLPKTDYKRNIIVIKKIKQTPDIYPRKSGIPSKKPLNK